MVEHTVVGIADMDRQHIAAEDIAVEDIDIDIQFVVQVLQYMYIANTDS